MGAVTHTERKPDFIDEAPEGVNLCAPRLRFEVHSYASVDEAAAKAAGADGVIRPAKNACQVVIKGDVQAVYDALRKQL